MFPHFSARALHTSSALAIRPNLPDPKDEKAMKLYKEYRPERITPNKKGVELLKSPSLNKVCCFCLFVFRLRS